MASDISLRDRTLPRGRDLDTFDKSSRAGLEPHTVDDRLAVMFESPHVFRRIADNPGLTSPAMGVNFEPAADGADAGSADAAQCTNGLRRRVFA